MPIRTCIPTRRTILLPRRQAAVVFLLIAMLFATEASLAEETQTPIWPNAIQAVQNGNFAALAALQAKAHGDEAEFIAALEQASLLRQRAALANLRPLLTDPEVAPELRAAAQALSARISFAHGNYGEAADAAQAALESSAASAAVSDLSGLAQLLAIATPLRDVPPQMLVRRVFGSIPTRRDAADLVRGMVELDGIDQEAVFDTGANLSVVSASAARRLGLKMMHGRGSVAGATNSQVPVRVAIAEHLELAGSHLRNVAFLVLDDADLEFPLLGGYKIDAIVGFPVFLALQRFRFGPNDTFSVIARARASAATHLRAAGNDLFAEVEIGADRLWLHLDTGARHSTLSSRFAGRHLSLVEGFEAQKVGVAGAGGQERRQVFLWRNPPVRIGSSRPSLKMLMIEAPGAREMDSEYAGTLGNDILRQYESYEFDLEQMMLTFGGGVTE